LTLWPGWAFNENKIGTKSIKMAQNKELSGDIDLPLRSGGGPSLHLGSPDDVLKGGLSVSELHELTPAGPTHHGAALGFALALAALSASQDGAIVFVQQDFAALEGAALYGLGGAPFGIDPERFLLVRAATPKDALWAMEEALKMRGITAVIGELAERGEAADLTATRRLSLAVQKGGNLALLLRQYPWCEPSAAATRWRIAGASGASDEFGGLGATAFSLTLTKNRRGPCGTWVLQWDQYAKRFFPALSGAVAQPAIDRPAGAAVA
jgi:protein ImuA